VRFFHIDALSSPGKRTFRQFFIKDLGHDERAFCS
jgi:hypothetical protein